MMHSALLIFGFGRNQAPVSFSAESTLLLLASFRFQPNL